MARYIDADKFKKHLEAAQEKMHVIGIVKAVDVGAVIMALDMQPSADVAPKSEVAREIFEEIEDSIAVHAFTRKSEDYAEGMYDAIEWVDSKIAELKKKYTEDKNS